jgi:hypothetical protein
MIQEWQSLHPGSMDTCKQQDKSKKGGGVKQVRYFTVKTEGISHKDSVHMQELDRLRC